MRLGFSFFLAVCCTAVPLGASCVNTRILASLSEQIGEFASMAAIQGMIPGAEQLPSALPGGWDSNGNRISGYFEGTLSNHENVLVRRFALIC
jgi:hypothetical protein